MLPPKRALPVEPVSYLPAVLPVTNRYPVAGRSKTADKHRNTVTSVLVYLSSLPDYYYHWQFKFVALFHLIYILIKWTRSCNFIEAKITRKNKMTRVLPQDRR